MNCKYCGSSIPTTTYICPNCGKMASKEQITMLKDFNKNSGWKTNASPKQSLYKKEKAYEPNKVIGIILVPSIILILIIIALLKILSG